MRYVLDFGSANAGGAPTFSLFSRLDTGQALAKPAIVELGFGLYRFDFDWAAQPVGLTAVVYKAVLGADELSDVINGSAGLPRQTDASDIDVVNMALSHLGHTKRITAFDESTPASSAATLWYGPALRAALESAPWPFATKRDATAGVTSSRAAWSYQRALPADLIAAQYIDDASEHPRVPFELEDGLLFSDVESPELVYTYAPAVSKWSPLFLEAFTHYLASKLVNPLALDQRLKVEQLQEWRNGLLEARASALNQRLSRPPPDAFHILARG